MVGLVFRAEGLEDVTLRLDRFRQNMASMYPAFALMAQDVRTQVFGRRFAQQGLDGAPWAALSPRYAEQKARARPGAPILVYDGDLRDSMTTPTGGIYEPHDRGFTVGTDVPYAGYHQRGDGLPARPMVGPLSREDNRRLVKIMQRFIVEGTGA